VEQLFLIGGIAVAVGVYTYSRRVMMTVGDSLLALSPLAAFVVVVSHSLVLFIFSSTALESLLASWGLPTIPLLPVSGSQAVIGSVLGIGLLQGLRGVRQIRWRVLVGIASGWVTTPLIAAVIGFVLLFVVQNVFGQEVFRPLDQGLRPVAIERVSGARLPPLAGLDPHGLQTTLRPFAIIQRVQQHRRGLPAAQDHQELDDANDRAGALLPVSAAMQTAGANLSAAAGG
jgi:PiT family inorganic phosphate transporter